MSKAFHPLDLRVPGCKMRVGVTSKSKFILVKKLSSFLYLCPNCFLHFRKISNALPFVFLYTTLKSQFNRHFLSATPKYPVLACGRKEAQGRIMFSGRRWVRFSSGPSGTTSKDTAPFQREESVICFPLSKELQCI